jgi:hypothetical protein
VSNAKPMTLDRRLTHYLGREPRPGLDHEWDLYPAQRRRAWHKALRSGERQGYALDLYGRKGRPTPRRPRRG